MATYTISVSFTATAKNDDKANELATQMIYLIESEGLAKDGVVIDIELLDDQDEGDELEFEDE